jgi:hypothetical protein
VNQAVRRSPPRRHARGRLAALSLAALAAAAMPLRAQDRPAAAMPPWIYEGNMQSTPRDDYREWHFTGGFRFRFFDRKLSIRGDSALVLTDLDEDDALLARDDDGLPRRGIAPPAPRRRLTNDEIRERLTRTLAAFGADGAERIENADDRLLEVPRFFYCEGGVVVVQDGVEVVRCDRLWISPLDDRIVVENAELRYAAARGTTDTLVVRAPRLVKQGGRWTGRDVVITTCNAGEPHVAIAQSEIEIIERDGEFEIFARGQSLQVGGTSLLPLPDAHVFTGSQSQFPIRRVRAAHSAKEGAQTEVVFGLPWNTSGGAFHHWLTGRSPKEFRGDWELGVGWIQERGTPLDGMLSYRAAGLYEGRTEAFWIDDRGDDLREITTNLDGSDVADGHRGVVRTQNRVHLGPTTHLDLVAFHASDAAVYSEFYRGHYRAVELPETSAYLHHADGNRLLTVGTRTNLSEFSYRDDRALAERFVEELPVVTYHWLAQPIGTTPWSTPIVVDLATEIGQRRSDYDDRAGFRVGDRTLRGDQLVEVSAPFHFLDWNVRPFVSGRGTWYDETLDGDSEGRIAATAGVQLGSRWSRTWSWLDDGRAKGLRHVIAPRISWLDRFHVDDERDEFFVFDDLDTLGEEQLVRVELRNLLQTMHTETGLRQPRDLVFVDLAQDFFPEADRDNGGDELGLFRYDLLLRPPSKTLPVETFSYAIYGDHDWEDGLRTLDTELQFGPVLGLTWGVAWRRDAVADAAVGLYASTQLLDRWGLFGSALRDLESEEWLSWQLGMRRDDHDWSIYLNAVYDPFADETTLRLEFEPRLGSFNSPRGSRFTDGAFDPFLAKY